jgi:hypothetical protein
MKYFGRRKPEVLRKTRVPVSLFIFTESHKKVNSEQTRALEIRGRPRKNWTKPSNYKNLQDLQTQPTRFYEYV